MPMGIVWIIRARGLAPSVGAGGTIVAAGLCCLLFVSALLTFRSWPSDGGPGSDGSLLVRVPEAKAAGRVAEWPAPVSAAPARPARPDRPAAARRPARPVRGGGGAPAARVRFRGPQPRSGTVAPPASRPSAPAASPAQQQPASPPPSSPTRTSLLPDTPKVPDPPPVVPPGTVENTVRTARGVVDGVTQQLPPAPPVVAQPVQQTLDTVQGAAQTVDGVTGALLP
jgi:hypothetical protein